MYDTLKSQWVLGDFPDFPWLPKIGDIEKKKKLIAIRTSGNLGIGKAKPLAGKAIAGALD